MGEWKEKSLGDVCNIIPGYAFKSGEFLEEGVPVVKIKDITPPVVDFTANQCVDAAVTSNPKLNKYKVGKDDFVAAMTGATIGKVGRVRTNVTAYINQRVAKFEPLTTVDREFVYYQLLTNDFQEFITSNVDSHSAQENISGTSIGRFPILIPEVGEQRAIASVLSSLDAKIDLLHRQNKTLEALAETLFRQWFVELNGPSDAGGDWESTVLGKAVSVLEAGRRPPGGVSAYTSGVPSIGAESIVGLGHFDYNKTKYVPREYYDRMQRGIVKDMDVLLYKDGGRPGEFEPHVTMVGHGFPFTECCINEHVFRIRTDGVLPQSFLYFWLSSDAIMDEMRNSGTGAAIPGLNASAVRDLTLEVPPQTLMKQFADLADPMVTRILANCKEARTLSKLRDTLLPKLMSGEVRVEMPLSAIVV